MSTFDKVGDEAWRKCWVCDTRVYSVKGKAANDNLAPINTWVDVDLSSRILVSADHHHRPRRADETQYGDKIDAARQRTPQIYSGLVLDDLPTTSTFGRPPSSTTPVLYPSEPQTPTNALLPPIPDPFFLPPPFIPNHPALREMCKAAVVALQERHDEIERDIRSYIVQRAQDMKRLEDQVRAEVEALWDRYVQGPLRGQDVDRRGSVTIRMTGPAPRSTSNNVPPPPSDSLENDAVGFERARSKDDLPSGVVPDPPSLGTQFNAHTAVAASSLLSASLANNAFHAPPPRRAAQNMVDIEELAKTASRDAALSREQAMSYAFSAMEEHAGAGRRRRDSAEMAELKKARKETEAVEEEAEEREKGIDSWAAMERSQATKALTKEVDAVNAVKASTPVDKDGKDSKEVVANGSKDKKDRPGPHVKFQVPDKATIEKEMAEAQQENAEADAEAAADGVDDDDGELLTRNSS